MLILLYIRPQMFGEANYIFIQYIYINEQVQLHNQDTVLNAAAKRLGVSLRQTEDQLMSNMLLSSAARINCVGGVNADNPTELTSDDCDAAIQSLLNANAWTIQDFVEAENKFGTAPVRAAYLALASTKIQPDLEKVDGFIAANQYPSPMNLLRTEWGVVRNLRFHLSTLDR